MVNYVNLFISNYSPEDRIFFSTAEAHLFFVLQLIACWRLQWAAIKLEVQTYNVILLWSPHNKSVHYSQSSELVAIGLVHIDHMSRFLRVCVPQIPWLRVSADHHATMGEVCSSLCSSHAMEYKILFTKQLVYSYFTQ